MSLTLRRCAASFVAVALCVLATVCGVPQARAGYFQIKDMAGMFSQADAERLHARASSYPFDVRVVTTSTLGSRNAFDRFMNDQLIAPNMVVVGLDPAQRRTSVHYGRATGIGEAAYKAIEQAGSVSFRAGAYAEGVERILDAAAREAHPTAPASPEIAGEEPLALRWGLGAVVLAATAFGSWVIVALLRKRSDARAGS